VNAPGTWHFGLVAEWWANFNIDGPEIDYFGRLVAEGQPSLDAGCGTGRLLLPWLRAGYDVDGSDVSPDMIALCRERVQREGFDPTLLVQPLHELDPPRRYRSVVVCGALGLGTTRAQDQAALSRIRECLEPGGTLLLDNQAPYVDEARWRCWTTAGRRGLPAPWPDSEDRRQAADGSTYALASRIVAADPLDQTHTLEIRARKWKADRLVATEEYALSVRSYFRDELLLMLDRAGFHDVHVRGGYGDDPPTPEHEFLVYIAHS
jgi:SAM-dependent methyltransferase